MSTVASAIFGLLVCWLLASDIKQKGALPAIWCVVAWIILIGSRPLSSILGIGSGSSDVAAAYDEGGPIDRFAYLVIIVWGLLILHRREVSLGQFAKFNQVLFLFFLYWALSILWADAPFVALKRWAKDAGNIVMVLVVLSDRDPGRAMLATLKRSAIILVPLSILLIRFFPEWGRTFHGGTGEMMFTGVTTHKNSLGMLAFVCLLFLVWDFLRATDGFLGRSGRGIGDFALIWMTGSLLVNSASATAIAAASIGVVLVCILSLQIAREHIWFLEFLALSAGIGLWAGDLAIELFEFVVVDIFGRDTTLTTRTDVWPLLLSNTDGILFGSGFNSFWTGARLADLYDKLGIIQAHNGYIETYLNGGVAGLGLLGLLLFSTIGRINRGLIFGDSMARLAFAVFASSIFYNFTEAAYNKNSVLWFVFLLMIMVYRKPALDGRRDEVVASPKFVRQNIAARRVAE